MGEKILEVKDLYVTYKSDDVLIKAVNGISFEIGEKESIGLVGETGAGKTTTALAIMSLLPKRTGSIAGGDVLYQGKSAGDIKKDEMRKMRGAYMSMIFQDPMTSLNPVMTVGEQILESLKIHNHENLSKEELAKRVDELLMLVGIPAERKIEYPHQFSGGMKQRVVIAIALACDPKLLIADEPTTALDVTIQAQVLALMSDLKEKLNTSIIMITHDLGVVAETCDKVAIMYAGEIVEKGTLSDIFEGENHHPYTEGLFGAIPDIHSKSPRLSPIDGLMPDPAALPEGCKFHPRCKYCMEICKSSAPYIYRAGEHEIACHLFAKEEL